MGAIGSTGPPLLTESFTAQLNPAVWNFNVFTQTNNASFYGRTQQQQLLPSVSGGFLRLDLDTFNPTNQGGNLAFEGSEAISRQLFSPGSTGIAIEARMAFSGPIVGGIVVGFFMFADLGPGVHDEIDFELLSNDAAAMQVHTNLYANEPLGEGHPASAPIPGGVTDFHTYRIEWLPDRVRFLVDGQLVRESTSNVPTHPMAVHLNIWAPSDQWAVAYNSALQPAATMAGNVSYRALVDDLQVTALSTRFGTVASDTLAGGANDDWIEGKAGDDSLLGGDGVDNIYGGAGADTIDGAAGSSYLRGDDGDDFISGGPAFDDMNGNMGNDTAAGGIGDDWVVGGKDSDSLSGGAGGDIVYGNLGSDTCNGDEGNDIVRGGQDDDSCSGGAGDDFVSGDRGADTMVGGAGADLFHTFGDAGLDRVLDFNLAQGDRVMLDPGTQFTASQVGADTVINMTGGGQMVLVGVELSTLTGTWIFGA